jgi:hypothetical protein
LDEDRLDVTQALSVSDALKKSFEAGFLSGRYQAVNEK